MTKLHAGPIALDYEAGAVRVMRIADRELLRHIYMAVRDSQWNTIPARISRETVTQDATGFRIELEAHNVSTDIDFSWSAVIEGGPGPVIRYQFSGQANRDFDCNRIGLCILHPIDGCAGQPCTVEHSDGRREEERFPEFIAPDQPFLDVKALSHEVWPGCVLEIRLAGDVFETEDQRNWTDYSYKTYSWALADGIPVSVKTGRRIEQSVEMRLQEAPITLTVDESKSYPWPLIGSTVSPLAYLRVDLKLGSPDSMRELPPGVPLEVALWIDSADQLDALTALPPGVSRILVFPGAPYAEAVRAKFTGIPVGGGSSADFADLNRNRGVVASLDFLCWGMNPHIHQPDHRTAVENLEGQSAAVASAKLFSGGRPICISPVLIPNDPGADGWVAACIRRLASAGVSSITFAGKSPLLEALHALRPEQVVSSHSSDPLRAEALVLRHGTGTSAWVVNFLPEAQTVIFAGQAMKLGGYETLRVDLPGSGRSGRLGLSQQQRR